MPFRYSCFIRYRHPQQAVMAGFVDQFEEALRREPLLKDLPVYRDIQRLKGGDLLDASVARGLCESVCMIMVYTDGYFCPEHTFCTREYLAMTELERSRLTGPGRNDVTHGLIIPVVLRGFDQMPDEIKNSRLVCRFDDYYLGRRRLVKNPRFQKHFRDLAHYVAARYRELSLLDSDCAAFELPLHDTALLTAHKFSGRAQAFPGRNS